MSYYKKCPYCGYINEAPEKSSLRICQNGECSRNISNVMAKTEEEYREYLEYEERIEDAAYSDSPENEPEKQEAPVGFYLKSEKYGITIPIPEGESTIGRDAVGKKELEKFLSISRNHLQVNNNGEYLLIKDISTYGTSLDGSLINDHEEHFAICNATIKLHNIEFKLLRNEG